MGSPLRAVALVVCAALASGLAVFLAMRKPAPSAGGEAQSEQLVHENQSLRERVAQLERDLQTAPAPHGESAPVQGQTRREPPSGSEEARLDLIRSLTQTQAKLQAANTSLIELQEKTIELESAVARLTEENRKLQAAGEEGRESLASTRRVVDAMEAELKTKSDRIAQLETAARKLREENVAAAQKSQQWPALVRDLEDINRRRENTLAQLQRRYRDLTDQFRSLAVRLDNQRDNPAPLTPDLSRIQTTVQSAEEDLRQIVNLNTQALRAAQRLTSQK